MNRKIETEPTRTPAREAEDALQPAVDVIEDARGITLIADLPGVPKDRLSLHVEADRLVIEAEISLSAPEGISLTHAELPAARYRRMFSLSKELDAERVRAEFADGVLRLHIPRVQQAQPRRIEIRVG